jgi:Repeating coiled region of VPS13
MELNFHVTSDAFVCLQRAVTEMIAFFQTPNLNVEDVKAIAQTGIEKIASISRSGLQYAIEQHKVCILRGLRILSLIKTQPCGTFLVPDKNRTVGSEFFHVKFSYHN